MNMLVVVLLVTSVLLVIPQQTTKAQPYEGMVITKDYEGENKAEFALGSRVYFKIRNFKNGTDPSSEELRVELEGLNTGGTTWTSWDTINVNTSEEGNYESWTNGTWFDIDQDYVPGREYSLNITNPVGDYTNATFTIYTPDYSSESNLETWDHYGGPDDIGEPRTHFVERTDLYWNASIKDQNGHPPDVGEVDVEVEGVGSVDSNTLSPEDEGEIYGSFYLWGHNYDPGDYTLNVLYEGDVVESTTFTVYEPDYSDGSTVKTYESEDFEIEKDFFIIGHHVYYQAEVIDQHGWHCDDGEWIRIYTQEKGEEDEVHIDSLHPSDGMISSSFYLSSYRYSKANYDLIVKIDSEEIARKTFTVIEFDISIEPDQYEYAQGQDIEIRIESNYPNDVNISIMNETYWVMPGAEWTEQSFTNEFWSAEYTIPSDIPDGEYYIVVNRSDDDKYIGSSSLRVKMFSLSLETNKRYFLSGETVHAYYTVTNNLDGTQAEDITVEWRAKYYDDDDDEWNTIPGSTKSGDFWFEIPEEATSSYPSDIIITAWANDTDDHSDRIDEYIYVRNIDAYFSLDSDQYIPGQTMYVDVGAAVNEEPLENADVDVEIFEVGTGTPLSDYTTQASTDESGRVVIPIELSSTIESGFYKVSVNVTKYNSWDAPPEETFEVIDESKILHVHLEKDKDGDYYPGDQLMVSYVITHLGEDVTEQATVRYRIESSNGVTYDYDFASDGSIVFDIPSDWTKNSDITVSVWANIDNEIIGYGELDVDVSSGKVIMNADPQYYQAGETITFSYELVGIDDYQSISYKVTDRAEQEVIETGTPSGGQFSFQVPSLPLDSYKGIIDVVTNNGALVSNQLQVNRYGEYNLQIEILTPSDYQNDVYAPGQEIDVQYTFTTSGDAEVPEILILTYNFENGLVYTLQTTEFQDTFTVEVPDGEGTQSLFVNDNFGNFAMEQIDVTRYHMDIEVTTESDYTTGVYTPGQKLKVKYTIMPTGDFDLPSTVTLHYGFISSNTTTIEVSELNGTFTIKVPKGVSGEHHLQAWVGQSMSEENIQVEEEPSWLSKKSPISSLSQIGFIMLILLIIALILGSFLFIIVMFKRPATGPRTYEEPEEEEEWEEEPVKEQPPTGPRDEYVIEEGEPEPEDTWEDGPIEGDEEW